MSGLESEKVVIQAPMSYTGSARRLWRMTRVTNPAAKVALIVAAVTLIAIVWTAVTAWYVVFSFLLVPYRLIRRGGRKRKQAALRHQETMAAIARSATPPPPPPNTF